MDKSDVRPPGSGPACAVMGLLSRTGPEVPPDITNSALEEPTASLPLITPAAPAAPPQETPPEPKVTARAVIVYEPEPRPRRGLWVFTALLVALTAGVVLGQTSAYQPPSRSVSATQTAPLPVYQTPPVVVPSAAVPAMAVPRQQITALLGSAKTRLIEVTGASTSLRIRSADLGPLLFSIGTADGSAMPGVVDTPAGPRLSLTRTGTDATEVQLNSKVRWTIRLNGESITQEIDMRAGGLAGIELAGAASDAMLALPRPTKAVGLRVTGAISSLRIRTGDDAPVRLRLGKGAEIATLDGTQHRNAKSGSVLASPGWQSAKKRYDIKTYARVHSVVVDHTP
jgi:hypothetical protein